MKKIVILELTVVTDEREKKKQQQQMHIEVLLKTELGKKIQDFRE